MTLDLNDGWANTLLALYGTNFPAGSTLNIRTGAPPGAGNAETGTLLVSITLPSTPWGAAAAGVIANAVVWAGAGIAAGTAGYFRLKNAGDTLREEGTITVTGGGGDMTVDNTSIAVAQVFNVNTYAHSL